MVGSKEFWFLACVCITWCSGKVYLKMYIRKTLEFVFPGHENNWYPSQSCQSWRKHNPSFVFCAEFIRLHLCKSLGFAQKIIKAKEAPVWRSNYSIQQIYDNSVRLVICACSHLRTFSHNYDHTRQVGWFPLHLLNYRSWCLVMFVHYWEWKLREGKTKRKIVLICVSAWVWCIWPDPHFNTFRETLSSIMAALS